MLSTIICRHVRSEGLDKGIAEGREGVLTDRGREQAVALAHDLARYSISRIYVGTYVRHRQTLDTLLAMRAIPVIETPMLDEIHQGLLTGEKKARVRSLQRSSGQNFGQWRPSGGETRQEAQRRIVTYYTAILEESPSGCLLFLSSAGVISGLLAHLLRRPLAARTYAELHPSPGAYSMFSIDAARHHTLRVLNTTAHLRRKESFRTPDASLPRQLMSL